MKFFVLGFIINTFTSFDDALTRVPLLGATTRTRAGRIAFSIGNLLAVTVAVALSVFFAQTLLTFSIGKYVVASFVFFMAIVVYFDMIKLRPPKKVLEGTQEGSISTLRFSKLLGLGFFATLVTMTDDIFALAPLFLDGVSAAVYAVVGIYLSSILLTIGVFYFSEKITAIPYKKEIATITLVVFGGLILGGVV